jgi:(p)ppGpp synthase/HD superfamily hydrolase
MLRVGRQDQNCVHTSGQSNERGKMNLYRPFGSVRSYETPLILPFFHVISLREAGEILLMDYLQMQGSLILNESYIDEEFTIPTTVEEIAELLPGNTQYDDIDDLLISIGKQHDRAMLHSSVSKLFKVNKRLLQESEKNRKPYRPQRVLDSVYTRHQKAKQVAASAGWPKPSTPAISIEKVVKTVVNGCVEYADPEHCCETCLPVYGDKIVGTRPEDSPDSTPKVHRLGCPHAQRAINRALAESKQPAANNFNCALSQRVDSDWLRKSRSLKESNEIEVPVKLRWPEFRDAEEQQFSFPCEVVVHAEDRKLLLADCSEIVSELSEIVKTGSQTTNEHATLVFLINVQGIADLQTLMDSLHRVRSVMAVERRVSNLR